MTNGWDPVYNEPLEGGGDAPESVRKVRTRKAAAPVETPEPVASALVSATAAGLAKRLSDYAEERKQPMSENEFDFVDDYAEEAEEKSTLDDNTAASSLNCAFVGIGGGGGKIASAFLRQGFKKTLLLNTTKKEFGEGVEDVNCLPLADLDGVAKNIDLGKKALKANSAVIEDGMRAAFGKVDWLFVCAGGGGGTGSSCAALAPTFKRYLESVEADGGVVYIVTRPTAQELLNPTIKENYLSMGKDLAGSTFVLLDNERQLNKLRGKVGVSGLYPRANEMFAKMFSQILSLTSEESVIQVMDGKDLARFFSNRGRIMIGTAVVEPSDTLGADLYQKCILSSPCPEPGGQAKVGLLLEVMAPDMAEDPSVGTALESAASYVGGRSDTVFVGVYVKPVPSGRVISIMGLGGLGQKK